MTLDLTDRVWADLNEVLEARADQHPDAPAFTFRRFRPGRVAEEVLTYGELAVRARHIGRHLRRKAAPGSRALLVYPPSLDFVTAWFGCLRSGIVAVPSSVPHLGGDSSRLAAIARDCRPRLVLTSGPLGTRLARWLETFSRERGIELVYTERLRRQPPASSDLDPAPATAFRTAAIQYTSGSTGAPKGVELSHRNLIRNLELCAATGDICPNRSRIVSWLPMFHDMGLVFGVLEPVFWGVPALLMAPVEFVKRPSRWLCALSDSRGTHTTAPNFALELCTRKADANRDAGLDLRHVTVLNCGSEPIRSRALAEFGCTFARFGLPPTSLSGGYGLAEFTLLVSLTPPGEEPTLLAVDRDSLAEGCIRELGTRTLQEVAGRPPCEAVAILVGCGRGTFDTEIVVVDPDTGQSLGERQVGEVWVSGESAAEGYWEQPHETARTFRARLADGRGPFLRTGDLGFLHRGELFITGRLKELIIIDGRNHYPQDLEFAAQRSHPAIEPGRCAAFSIDAEAGERLVIACEVTRAYEHSRHRQTHSPTPEMIVAAVRESVAHEHGVRPHEVVLLAPGRLPRTTSGKLRRRGCREDHLRGDLKRLSP